MAWWNVPERAARSLEASPSPGTGRWDRLWLASGRRGETAGRDTETSAYLNLSFSLTCCSANIQRGANPQFQTVKVNIQQLSNVSKSPRISVYKRFKAIQSWQDKHLEDFHENSVSGTVSLTVRRCRETRSASITFWLKVGEDGFLGPLVRNGFSFHGEGGRKCGFSGTHERSLWSEHLKWCANSIRGFDEPFKSLHAESVSYITRARGSMSWHECWTSIITCVTDSMWQKQGLARARTHPQKNLVRTDRQTCISARVLTRLGCAAMLFAWLQDNGLLCLCLK